jgi:hypothetical protein
VTPHLFSHGNTKIKRMRGSECPVRTLASTLETGASSVIIKPREKFSENDRKIHDGWYITCVPLPIHPHAVKLGGSDTHWRYCLRMETKDKLVSVTFWHVQGIGFCVA